MAFSQFKSLFAPTEGWDTTSPLAELGDNKAYILDNLIPSTSSVVVRKGANTHATNVGSGPTKSLFELKAGTVNKFIAASTNGAFYDVSTAGNATLIQGGFSSTAVWQGAIANSQIGLVNGVDTPQVYDGTTMSNMTVSNVTVTDLKGILAYKNRTYFFLKDSQSFWYSPLNTMGGALVEFPLRNVGTFGGNLVAMQTLASKDGGTGQEDLLCFFMSTGEVIIYSGTDPASNFVLVGVYKSGRPISNKGIIKYGADIFCLTNEGYIPLSGLLPLAYGKTNSELSRDIQGAADQAIQSAGTLDGWEACLSPFENLLIINVPTISGSYVQHVLNTNTKKWCRFTGLKSYCWANFGNDLYFGTEAAVYKYGGDYTDFDSPISATYASGYLQLGKRPVRLTAMRPRLVSDGEFTLSISHSSDFNPYTLPYDVTYGRVGSAWGATATQSTPAWGSPWATTTVTNKYLNMNTFANNFSMKVSLDYSERIELFGFNLLSEDGRRI